MYDARKSKGQLLFRAQLKCLGHFLPEFYSFVPAAATGSSAHSWLPRLLEKIIGTIPCAVASSRCLGEEYQNHHNVLCCGFGVC